MYFKTLNLYKVYFTLQTWTDILLTWDPADYGGLDHVRVPIEKIWSPDIVLYN